MSPERTQDRDITLLEQPPVLAAQRLDRSGVRAALVAGAEQHEEPLVTGDGVDEHDARADEQPEPDETAPPRGGPRGRRVVAVGVVGHAQMTE